MKTTILTATLLLLAGCSSLQPSRYENYSRDGENRVVAQGQAASNAAWVHASSATLGGGSGSPSAAYGPRSGYAERDVLAESTRRIYEDRVRTTSYAVSSSINESIRDALR
ncbi:hypothetical protein F2Q65_12290 [Thiohalocapsa marina]|uniref:Uncharacterized protein n=1 Tax=Thiohalocapsa marina TaxID=424902 RepID=A0A5M8FPX7_9GAMM|nr:hypothetical protein [Thiohalocapsa marina]KAA6184485.1 hypothetical protein F2Q65_12290 [Thiohalocapsa marina]